jgi:ferric-dicitrate binding protein FerR (iron transport regulator)
MDVIVTGTQFNVITRYDKNSVFLAEGSVTLQTKDGREIKMLPGDFVELNDNRLRKKTANEEAILAWKNNQLLFEGTTMPEVAKIITEHYGIKVILANMEVRNGTLSGIMANDNLDVLLKSLEAAKNYKITRNDSEIIIAKP